MRPEICFWGSAAVSWALQSSRPLHISELATVLAFQIGLANQYSMACLTADLKRHLGFVLRVENNFVLPFSSSTLAILGRVSADGQLADTTARPSRFRLLSHADLAAICLEYLIELLSGLEDLEVSWESCLAELTWTQECLGTPTPILGFLNYATLYWASH